MEIEYTAHARERMAERGIFPEEVEEALSHEIDRDAGTPGTLWIYGWASGSELKVCVRAADFPKKVVVVTVVRQG